LTNAFRPSTLYEKPFHVAKAPTTIKARAFYKDRITPLKVVQYDGVDFQFLYNGHYKPVDW
jgi:hypothetical protein